MTRIVGRGRPQTKNGHAENGIIVNLYMYMYGYWVFPFKILFEIILGPLGADIS